MLPVRGSAVNSKWDIREKKKIALVREKGLTEMMRKNGITEHMDSSHGALRKKNHEKWFNRTCRCFARVVPGRFVALAAEHPFGGVERRLRFGQNVSISTMLLCYFLSRISEILRPGVSILEIGGGYGGLARMIAEHEPSANMTIVDLPISLEIQRFYLSNTSRATFTFSLEVPDVVFDLAVSTQCFCELDIEEVNSYLTEINRALIRGGHFYCVSRDEWKGNIFKLWKIPVNWQIVDQRVYPFEPNYTERFWRMT